VAPKCVVESRAVDLTDPAARRALFAEVGAVSRRVIVVTEGLLIYLDPSDVLALAHDLHAQTSFAWWLTDLGSPPLLKYLERTWAPTVRAANAPFRFAPAEGTRFFAPAGWKEAEFRSFWEEAFRLERTFPLARLWRWIGSLAPAERKEVWRKFSAVVRLDRIGEILPRS
jgi:O-methyltransferase involved in polyketide biosynthesis